VQLSCGEHCDYGLLTLVNQDPHVTALQVGRQPRACRNDMTLV
jgi:isopenicillin N synthase-like dioxygenase